MSRLDRLLATVADRPAGEKVHIPALIRAFTPTQAETIAAIQHLIAAGKLDAATLRRPTCAKTQTDPKCVTETPAEVPEPKPTEPPAPKAVAEGGGVARKIAPPPSDVSGPDLIALLETFIATHGLARGAVSKHLFGSSGNISLLRYTRQPRAATVAKVSAFLTSDPPPELQRKPRKGQKAKRRPPLGDRRYAVNREKAAPAPSVDLKVNKPRIAIKAKAELVEKPSRVIERRDPTQPPELPLTELRDRQITTSARQVAARKRTIRQQAQAFLDAGVPSHKAGNQEMRGAMLEIQQRQEEETRLADPVERAKSILRRRYSPVIAAETSGGPEGKFYVGRKLVTKTELLDMARKLAA